MKLRLSKALGILGFVLSGGLVINQVYHTELAKELQARESHDLCHNTPKQEAWVAYKDGESRCFLIYKEYPHKITGGYIDAQ